ncbi:3-coathanger stack domain-containing protein [Emticicia sp. C21]|uniref:3-coathanger stack domain-containing protein n=1 Tax=Emticicia sp. C21 TaxID=2302915 RepID=UPI000E352F1D|nr:3-coathanger stack domain-containing protein [Emticicia sp. C21]RFS16501.1 hypothetical protein D0T08_12530 [Emticicia sp. C21]
MTKTFLLILVMLSHFALSGQENISTFENEIASYELKGAKHEEIDCVLTTTEIPPKPIITTDRDIICDGDRATLTATGCYGTITWNTGATGIYLVVTTGGTFSATCTNQSGTSEVSYPVIIKQFSTPDPPTISISSPVLCGERSKMLIASGCNGRIRWSIGATQSSITVSASGTYSATCESICGVSAFSNLIVIRFLFPPYILAENTGPYQTGETIHLNGLGSWRNMVWRGPDDFMARGDSVKILNAGIAESGIYTLTVTDSDGCSGSDTTHVIVEPCHEKLRFNYVSTEPSLQYLFSLKYGMILNKLSTNTGILATPVCQLDTSKVGSIRMQMTGPEPFYNRNIIENVYPYSILSNNGFQIFGSVFPVGQYTLTFTAFSEISAHGNILFGPQTVQFSIVDSLAIIHLDSLNITEICPGASLDISFSNTGSFLADNLFEVQLSDADGSFENPIKIGESTTNGMVHCKIPLNTSQGNAYRIRIYATKPALISNPSFDSFRIKARKINLQSPTDNVYSISNKEASEIIKASNKVLLNASATYQSGRYIQLNPGFEVNAGAKFETRLESCY